MENNIELTSDSTQQDNITENIIESYKEQIKSYLSKRHSLFRHGYMTEDSFSSEVYLKILNSFDSLLRECNIYFFGFSSNPFNYQAFIEDYNLWKEGRVPKYHTDMPWLFYNKKVLHDPLRPWAVSESNSSLSKSSDLPECSPIDKINFFRIMEGLLFPPELFQRLPDNVPRQNVIDRKPYNSSTAITIGRYCPDLKKDYWIDDSNTQIENYYPGSNIVLTDIYGLKTEFTILNECKEVPNYVVDFVNPSKIRVFNASGSIEGYTSARKRNLQVIFRENALFAITFDQMSFGADDDQDASDGCPVWQESYKFIEKKHSLFNELREKWVNIALKL